MEAAAELDMESLANGSESISNEADTSDIKGDMDEDKEVEGSTEAADAELAALDDDETFMREGLELFGNDDPLRIMAEAAKNRGYLTRDEDLALGKEMKENQRTFQAWILGSPMLRNEVISKLQEVVDGSKMAGVVYAVVINKHQNGAETRKRLAENLDRARKINRTTRQNTTDFDLDNQIGGLLHGVQLDFDYMMKLYQRAVHVYNELPMGGVDVDNEKQSIERQLKSHLMTFVLALNLRKKHMKNGVRRRTSSWITIL